MLTKKQLWRRINSSKSFQHRHESTTQENKQQQPHHHHQEKRNKDELINEQDNNIPFIHPFNTSNSHSSQSPIKLKSALSSGNLLELNKKLKISRILRFSATVHVLLIPSRLEIISHCINIYYITDDYLTFKRDAVQEIRDIAKKYNVSIKVAMNFLYQPNFELPNNISNSNESDNSSPEQISPSHSRESLQGMNHVDFIKTSKFLESELKFIIDAKTDVELQDQSTGRGMKKSNGTAPTLKQHAWVVQWKKQANIPPTGPVNGSVNHINTYSSSN